MCQPLIGRHRPLRHHPFHHHEFQAHQPHHHGLCVDQVLEQQVTKVLAVPSEIII